MNMKWSNYNLSTNIVMMKIVEIHLMAKRERERTTAIKVTKEIRTV